MCDRDSIIFASAIVQHQLNVMSAEEIDKKSQDLQWVAFMGDFSLLRNFLSRQRHTFFGTLFGGIDALLRGFGQVVFANNPISGLLIIITFLLTEPGTLVAAAGTGLLGLLLSLLLRDINENIQNGLTVYNPVLIGSVTYASSPKFYDDVDAFAILIIVVGTIFSVYLTRSLATGRFPCITVPFNVVEIILLLVLTMRRNNEFSDGSEIVKERYREFGENVTVPGLMTTNSSSLIFDTEKLDWGLVFRGIVVSASQVYAIDNVIAGSVIYLGIIVFSPTTALFSLFGAFTGSLVALGLGISYEFVYAGLWGYNSFLTGGAFGGLFLVLSGQTGAAAFVAIIFTTLLQYVAEPLMAKIGLPVLTIPFVVTAWLFFGLRDSIDGTFPRPVAMTFPESEFHNFRSRCRDLDLCTADDSSDPEIITQDEKKSSND